MFILRRPRPRSFTLFPYATLFRSERELLVGVTQPQWQHDPVARLRRRVLPGRRARPDDAAARPDRKSTRLNSSHSSISYAVFCLKKKNIVAPKLNVSPVRLSRITA